MNRKGSAPLIIILGIVTILGIAGGIYYFGTLKNVKPQAQNSVVTLNSPPQSTQSTIPTTQPSPTVDRSKLVPITNQSCPNAFPGIDTDKPMLALIAARDTASAQVALQMFINQYNQKILVASFIPSDYAKMYATWTTLSTDDWPNLASYGQIFICEWSKYPPDWIRQSKVTQIAIVKNLAVEGQSRAAMPDSQGATLFLDDGYGSSGRNYQQRVIHHEFYHLIEFVNYGDMYYKDSDWSTFNDPSFKYGSGGVNAYKDPNYANIEHPQTGFITGYATSAIEEDKAETYAYLFVKESYSKLQTWLSADSILLNKVNYLKKFIFDHNSLMDNSYFQRVNQ